MLTSGVQPGLLGSRACPPSTVTSSFSQLSVVLGDRRIHIARGNTVFFANLVYGHGLVFDGESFLLEWLKDFFNRQVDCPGEAAKTELLGVSRRCLRGPLLPISLDL